MTAAFDFDRLLDPAPLPLEMGYERRADGVLHVACRTDLHGCSGAMIDWWFASRPDTERYVWWHPRDHISSTWVGPIHQVEERFGDTPARQLLIQLRDPSEFFSAAALEGARAAGAVSALVCARGGESWQAPRDAGGRVLGSRLVHVVRDTPWGAVLRSHFLIGHDLPAAGRSAAGIAALVPDATGPALLAHCYNEFTFLSRFLPSLHEAENRQTRPVALPW